MMRAFPYFAAFLLSLSIVSAVSILVPEDLQDGLLRMDVGDDTTIDFTVRSDDKSHELTFFAYMENQTNGTYVTANDELRYEDDFNLAAYQTKTYHVKIGAVNNPLNDVVFKWGVIVDPDSSSDMSLTNVVQDDFLIRISGDPIDENQTNNQVDVEVKIPPSSSSNQGASSGGSGGLPASPSSSLTDSADQPEPSGDDTNLQDITPHDTSLSEARVDTSTGNNQRTTTASSDSASDAKNGKSVALLFIGLLLIFMVLAVMAVKIVKEESGDAGHK